MTAASVAVRDVSHRFGSRPALTDVSIVLHGGITALLGPNGAGKTMLLRSLATTLRLSQGTIHVDGLDAALVQPRTEIRRRLGFLPQTVAFPTRASTPRRGCRCAACWPSWGEPPRSRSAPIWST